MCRLGDGTPDQVQTVTALDGEAQFLCHPHTGGVLWRRAPAWPTPARVDLGTECPRTRHTQAPPPPLRAAGGQPRGTPSLFPDPRPFRAEAPEVIGIGQRQPTDGVLVREGNT